MIENLSQSGFEMLRFEHETLVNMVQKLNDDFALSPDLKPFEREMWTKRLDLLISVCEADGEALLMFYAIKARQNDLAR